MATIQLTYFEVFPQELFHQIHSLHNGLIVWLSAQLARAHQALRAFWPMISE